MYLIWIYSFKVEDLLKLVVSESTSMMEVNAKKNMFETNTYLDLPRGAECMPENTSS